MIFLRSLNSTKAVTYTSSLPHQDKNNTSSLPPPPLSLSRSPPPPSLSLLFPFYPSVAPSFSVKVFVPACLPVSLSLTLFLFLSLYSYFCLGLKLSVSPSLISRSNYLPIYLCLSVNVFLSDSACMSAVCNLRLFLSVSACMPVSQPVFVSIPFPLLLVSRFLLSSVPYKGYLIVYQRATYHTPGLVTSTTSFLFQETSERLAPRGGAERIVNAIMICSQFFFIFNTDDVSLSCMPDKLIARSAALVFLFQYLK